MACRGTEFGETLHAVSLHRLVRRMLAEAGQPDGCGAIQKIAYQICRIQDLGCDPYRFRTEHLFSGELGTLRKAVAPRARPTILPFGFSVRETPTATVPTDAADAEAEPDMVEEEGRGEHREEPSSGTESEGGEPEPSDDGPPPPAAPAVVAPAAAPGAPPEVILYKIIIII